MGHQDKFGMTLDSGWDCTGDNLEYLRAVDRLRNQLGRVPTLVDGFRLALSMGWVKQKIDEVSSDVTVVVNGEYVEVSDLILRVLIKQKREVTTSQMINGIHLRIGKTRIEYSRCHDLFWQVAPRMVTEGKIIQREVEGTSGYRWKLGKGGYKGYRDLPVVD
jgi:hypothetical protein